MKKLFALLFALFCLHAQAQKQDSICYRHIIAEPQGKLFSDKCKLRIDDGIKPTREKGKKGESITFISSQNNQKPAPDSFLTQVLRELSYSEDEITQYPVESR